MNMQSSIQENEAIKIVTPEDRSKVIAILTIAFTTCPLLRWLYPEPERYLRHFSGFLDYYAGDPYTDRSGAYFESGDRGALLWLTDKAHRDDARMMRFLVGSVPESRRTETERLFEELGKYHPKEPHWYFTMLGIDPMHQRSGWGGLLYRYGLAILDEAKGLAFSEATSSSSARLYERLGWKIVGEVQVGSSPPCFPMLHHPS
ncbi:GNAT family N-acetyltransferase [Bradyrhizobium sp. BRP56]|uniref:GNAT family N-acetyltransferase n=1 Tax=Bradyrhizobium sp. BRP56 TaxID=2793819 RepID=UPI003209FE00|nr:GNAT family N-acetyltransferase [Bradyrhizobium sp. BRP56]